MLLTPFIIVRLWLFTSAGINLSYLKDKKRNDYILFYFLCITTLIASYTFVDHGVDDGPPLRAIYFIDEDILMNIWSISIIANIILIIISKINWKRGKILKKENNIKKSNKKFLLILKWIAICLGSDIVLSMIITILYNLIFS